MRTQGSPSTPRITTVAGLAAGAIGIAVLWASGVRFPIAIPPEDRDPAGHRGAGGAGPMALGTGCGRGRGFVRHRRFPDQPYGDSLLAWPERNEPANRHLDSDDGGANRDGRRCDRHSSQLSQARQGPAMNSPSPSRLAQFDGCRQFRVPAGVIGSMRPGDAIRSTCTSSRERSSRVRGSWPLRPPGSSASRSARERGWSVRGGGTPAAAATRTSGFWRWTGIQLRTRLCRGSCGRPRRAWSTAPIGV
jgi:hypothetical protein